MMAGGVMAGGVMAEMMTSSGALIDVTCVDPSTIVLDDVAHALAKECRFGNHSPGHYSVAQHAHLVSRLCEEEAQARGLDTLAVVTLALQGLHHDDAEYLLGDVPSPRKRQLWFKTASGEFKSYDDVESELNELILKTLGIPLYDMADNDVVNHADDLALNIEWASMGRDVVLLGSRALPGVKLQPYRPCASEQACRMFVQRHHKLMARYERVMELIGEDEL